MRRTILFLGIAALVLWSSPAGAITNGEWDDERHPNVGALLLFEDDTYWQVCSGSVVSEDQFLTAAHCVIWAEPSGYSAADFFVSFDDDLDVQPDGSLAPDDAIGVTDWVWHPAFRWGGVAKAYNDVAVVTLAEDVAITPVTLPDEGFLTEQNAHGGLRGHVFVNVGYGVQDQTKSAINPHAVFSFDGHRSMSTSPFGALTPAYLKLLANSNATGQGGIGWGDSGGPHFFSDEPSDPDYNLAVAVTTAADPSLMALSENQRLDIPAIHDWLEVILAS
ncbi:MAG TPA: trypsin-like serine protease [Actinomycetota bacterium]